MQRPLKTVFFDAVGTLIYLPKPVGEHYREIALNHGADLSAESLHDVFRQYWKIAPVRQKTDGPRPEDDKGWWRTLVRQVIDRSLPTASKHAFDHEAYFEELYAHFALPGVWAAYPETETVIHTLRSRGVALGVISNFDRRLYRILDHLELTGYFEAVVISSEVGADKPDPSIFRRALTLFDVRPSEAVHVGDDPQRDGGAHTVGVEVFLLDRPERTLNEFFAWLERRENE